jgi:hypothetical protein
MDLMDLALCYKDFKWAKQIINISEENIANNNISQSQNTISYSSNYIRNQLEELGQLQEYLNLKRAISGLDILSQRKVIQNLVGEKDAETIFQILNDLQ